MEKRTIDPFWDRKTWNNINLNFDDLFNEYIQAGVDAEEARRLAADALDVTKHRKGYLADNKGADFPLKSVVFNGAQSPVGEQSKLAILDAKIFGAKPDCYYRLMYLANGRESNGKARWGITLAEYDKSTFASTDRNYRWLFIYNDDTLPGNEGNANWERTSDGIETITVDNGEIAVSLTVDREYMDTGATYSDRITISTDSPTAIIDPSNYFF